MHNIQSLWLRYAWSRYELNFLNKKIPSEDSLEVVSERVWQFSSVLFSSSENSFLRLEILTFQWFIFPYRENAIYFESEHEREKEQSKEKEEK